MLLEVQSNKDIRIQLNNGVYVFDSESATGKTYLWSMLRGLTSRNDIMCISYPEAKMIKSLYSIDDIENVRLVFLDRYDMYSPKYSHEIKQLASHCSILLDCKQCENYEGPVEYCTLKMTRDSLEVVGDDVIRGF